MRSEAGRFRSKCKCTRRDGSWPRCPSDATKDPLWSGPKNKTGFSEPVVLNAPELWWCGPEKALPGGRLSLFGRNLAQRPDFGRVMVYLIKPGERAVELQTVQAGKYRLAVTLPRSLEPGKYELWVYAGHGGRFGWGGPLPLEVLAGPPASARMTGFEGGNIQEAIDRLAASGGGTLKISQGVLSLPGTLVIPAGVSVVGEGVKKTVLISPSDPAVRLKSISGSGWNQGPAAVRSVGDLTLDRAAVWLAGDGAAISNLTLRGSPRTNLGVAVRSPKYPEWVRDCRVVDVKVCGCEGKQAENCGIRLFNAEGAVVTGNEVSGGGRRSSCWASSAAGSRTTGSCRRRSLAAIPRPISSAGMTSFASALSKTTSAPARLAPRPAAPPAGACSGSPRAAAPWI